MLRVQMLALGHNSNGATASVGAEAAGTTGRTSVRTGLPGAAGAGFSGVEGSGLGRLGLGGCKIACTAGLAGAELAAKGDVVSLAAVDTLTSGTGGRESSTAEGLRKAK